MARLLLEEDEQFLSSFVDFGTFTWENEDVLFGETLVKVEDLELERFNDILRSYNLPRTFEEKEEIPTHPAVFFLPGEAELLTPRGYVHVERLFNRSHRQVVWNGSNWVSIVVRKARKDNTARLVTVVLSDNSHVTCPSTMTLLTSADVLPLAERVPIFNIEPGTIVRQAQLPVINSNAAYRPFAFTRGCFLAASCYSVENFENFFTPQQLAIICSHPEHTHLRTSERFRISLEVPVNEMVRNKLNFLKGMMIVCGKFNRYMLKLLHKSKTILRDVKMMLLNMNVMCVLEKISEKLGKVSSRYSLNITWLEMEKLYKLGFSPRLALPNCSLLWCSEITVKEVIDRGRVDLVYSFEESQVGTCVVDGNLLGGQSL